MKQVSILILMDLPFLLYREVILSPLDIVSILILMDLPFVYRFEGDTTYKKVIKLGFSEVGYVL